MTRALAFRRDRRKVVAFVGLWLAMTVALAAPQSNTQCEAPLPGVNLAGGEFNGGAVPGTYAKDYIYPGPAEIAFAREHGLRLIRVPVLWERLEAGQPGEINPVELSRLDQALDLASTAKLVTILDIHNYGRHRGAVLTRDSASSLAAFWRALAKHYAKRDDVVFGLMNEPHDIAVDDWAFIAKTAVEAIRATGARNVVLVPGTNWDGAHSWQTAVGGRSNADALLPLAKFGNVVFEVHQYFDGNSSGTSPTCEGAGSVPPVLTGVGRWARANRVRMFLGEFGVSGRPECVQALDDALAVIERDKDAWYGWTYWSAGAWWGDYMFNVQLPKGDGPQAPVLARRAAALACRR